jgi:hypothetical protein
MLDPIIAALEQQDYATAQTLLKAALKQSPNDPWVQFYLGRLQEATGKPNAAAEIYRQLLQSSHNAKLVSQARQGLTRVGNLRASTAAPNSQNTATKLPRRPKGVAPVETADTPLGFLVLQAVPPADRPAMVQHLSQAMQIDPYTAGGLLPNRGWRLYRAAPLSDIQDWGEVLQAATIPARWVSLEQVQAIRVFRVQSLQQVSPRAIARCQTDTPPSQSSSPYTTTQTGTLTFDWAEVAQRVEGILPLFSPMVEVGYRERWEWKESVGDYAHFCDIHLPERGCILRLQDGSYDFAHSAPFPSPAATHRKPAGYAPATIRQRWNDLQAGLADRLQTPAMGDFIHFAESCADFATPLSHIHPHTHLPRASDHYLDAAFHLYSCLHFLGCSGK